MGSLGQHLQVLLHGEGRRRRRPPRTLPHDTHLGGALHPLASGNTGILKRQMPTMEACHQYQAAMAEASPQATRSSLHVEP